MKMLQHLALCLCILMTAPSSVALGAVPAADVHIIKMPIVVNGGNVYIPYFQGLSDTFLQETINETLYDTVMSFKNFSPESSLSGDFQVSFFNGNLVGIHFRGDSYTPGTAHPNKIDQGLHIDLVSGRLYSLADLFKAGTDFVSCLKSICAKNEAGWRLNLPGFWDGWTHDTFKRSWQGSDRAFLLSSDSIRLYSIPQYATGVIGGYKVPYAAISELINKDGLLWKHLKSKNPSDIATRKLANMIDRQTVQVGDIISGLTVKSVEVRNGSLININFDGEIELLGILEWSENAGDGPGYLLTITEPWTHKLPQISGFPFKPRQILALTFEADTISTPLPKEKSLVRIRLDNYSTGERQIARSARLVLSLPIVAPPK